METTSFFNSKEEKKRNLLAGSSFPEIFACKNSQEHSAALRSTLLFIDIGPITCLIRYFTATFNLLRMQKLFLFPWKRRISNPWRIRHRGAKTLRKITREGITASKIGFGRKLHSPDAHIILID